MNSISAIVWCSQSTVVCACRQVHYGTWYTRCMSHSWDWMRPLQIFYNSDSSWVQTCQKIMQSRERDNAELMKYIGERVNVCRQNEYRFKNCFRFWNHHVMLSHTEYQERSLLFPLQSTVFLPFCCSTRDLIFQILFKQNSGDVQQCMTDFPVCFLPWIERLVTTTRWDLIMHIFHCVCRKLHSLLQGKCMLYCGAYTAVCWAFLTHCNCLCNVRSVIWKLALD
jgi:hypothetical protein